MFVSWLVVHEKLPFKRGCLNPVHIGQFSHSVLVFQTPEFVVRILDKLMINLPFDG